MLNLWKIIRLRECMNFQIGVRYQLLLIAANFLEGILVEREDIISKRGARNDAGKLGTHCV